MVQNRMVKKGFIGAIVLAVILFGGVILGLMCTERIPAGYVGVVYNMNGGVDGEVLQQGWHLVSPTKKVTTYSIGAEAEADANAQIAASLTPELIDKIMYEKWNGELPTVSGSNAIVSMEGLK